MYINIHSLPHHAAKVFRYTPGLLVKPDRLWPSWPLMTFRRQTSRQQFCIRTRQMQGPCNIYIYIVYSMYIVYIYIYCMVPCICLVYIACIYILYIHAIYVISNRPIGFFFAFKFNVICLQYMFWLYTNQMNCANNCFPLYRYKVLRNI